MKSMLGILILLFLSLGKLAPPSSNPQGDAGAPKKANSTKADNKVAEAARPPASADITLHIKVSSQNGKALPTESSIKLESVDNTWASGVRTASVKQGDTSFLGLRACKVKLTIYITGIDTQMVLVDLANYKDPLQILINANGRAVIQPTSSSSTATTSSNTHN